MQSCLLLAGYLEAEQRGTLDEWLQAHSSLQPEAPQCKTDSEQTNSSALSGTFSEDLDKITAGPYPGPGDQGFNGEFLHQLTSLEHQESC